MTNFLNFIKANKKIVIIIAVAICVVVGLIIGIIALSSKPNSGDVKTQDVTKDQTQDVTQDETQDVIIEDKLTSDVINATIEGLKTNARVSGVATLDTSYEYTGSFQKAEQDIEYKVVKENGKVNIYETMSVLMQIVINKEEFIAAPEQDEDFLNQFLQSAAGAGYVVSEEGGIVTITIPSEIDECYYSQIDEFTYDDYSLDEDFSDDKFIKSCRFGDVFEAGIMDGFYDIISSFENVGTYNNETGYIEIDILDLPVNENSYYYIENFKVKVVDGRIAQIIYTSAADIDDAPIVQDLRFIYGDQTVTLPSGDSILNNVCNHDNTYESFKVLNGDIYECNVCNSCLHVVSYEKKELDADGATDTGYQLKKNEYLRIDNKCIAEILLNTKTNKIIAVDLYHYTDNEYIYCKYVKADQTYDNAYVVYYPEAEKNYCIINYNDGTNDLYDIVIDAIVNTEEKTVSGEVFKTFAIGEVYDINK